MEDNDCVISLCGRSLKEETSMDTSLSSLRLHLVSSNKWSMQYSILVALALLYLVHFQNLIVSSTSSSFIGAGLVEKEKVLSFLMPEQSDMRYPEFGNMTVTEKVASDYHVVRDDKSDYKYDPLANCSVTSQARIIQKSPHWILQSVDADGNDKTVGGDEFYVTYTDNQRPQQGDGKHTAAALISDLENGSYALDFVRAPMDRLDSGNLTGVGTLSVHFEYTCNIGRAQRPTKADWKFGGATLIHHSKSNITQPPIRAFQFPASDIDLSAFDLVVAFGDSMMETLVRVRGRPWPYLREKVNYKTNVGSDLNSMTLDNWLGNMEAWHGKQHFRNSALNVALLLGSSAWDITQPIFNAMGTRPEFSDHLDTCRRFVFYVKALYPNVTVIWKAPAAMHLHNVNMTKCTGDIRCITRLQYLSSSRAKYLYDEQMKIMNELRVPVLDIYEASYLSADRHFASDAIHYSTDFNKFVLGSFYKGGRKENRSR